MKSHSKYCIIVGIIVIIFLISGISHSSFGHGRFSFEFLPGGAITLPSTLFIRQEGDPDIKFTARYKTNSFNLPIYYSFRLGYSINKKSTVEIEMNHLKVKLDNNPPEIEVFSISHGFNQLWANYSTIYEGFLFRVGVGPVIAHPESIIRGKRIETLHGFANMGYYMSGITSQLAIQKKLFVGKHLFFSAETKFNAAYTKVKIADGFAKVPIYARHGLIGLGFIF